MSYQISQNDMILRLSDNAWIPNDPANTDYQTYLKWLGKGNTPDPYIEPIIPELTSEQKLANAGLTVDELKTILGLT